MTFDEVLLFATDGQTRAENLRQLNISHIITKIGQRPHSVKLDSTTSGFGLTSKPENSKLEIRVPD